MSWVSKKSWQQWPEKHRGWHQVRGLHNCRHSVNKHCQSSSIYSSIVSRTDFERELVGFVPGSLRPVILADYVDTEDVIFIVADLIQTGPANLCQEKVGNTCLWSIVLIISRSTRLAVLSLMISARTSLYIPKIYLFKLFQCLFSWTSKFIYSSV